MSETEMKRDTRYIDEIRELKKLCDEGAITEKDFKRKKQQLLRYEQTNSLIVGGKGPDGKDKRFLMSYLSIAIGILAILLFIFAQKAGIISLLLPAALIGLIGLLCGLSDKNTGSVFHSIGIIICLIAAVLNVFFATVFVYR